MEENEIARIVADLCFQIHHQYGPGLYEQVYENVLCYELEQEGIGFARQQVVPLVHKDLMIPIAFRADLIIENKMIIELKSVEELAAVHYK